MAAAKKNKNKNQKKDQKKGKKDAPQDSASDAALDRFAELMEWPGMLGWLGTAFGIAGVWFLISWLVLGSALTKLEGDTEPKHEIAEGTRNFGFGERFIEPVMRRVKVDDVYELVVPDPLTGMDLKRTIIAVRENARASGVFGLFCFFLVAFLWGMRLYEPALKAEHEPPEKSDTGK